MSDNEQDFPEINDKDVAWVTDLMRLPKGAFAGERENVLKHMLSGDIQACPGSGKTTLLVAKLAILAKKWNHRTRGICVISHTNSAKDTIGKKLGKSSIGQKLLSYPHFIGTIHGFVNEFIALPWIRTKKFPISLIDAKMPLKSRWARLPDGVQYALMHKMKKEDILKAKDIDGNPESIPWGKGELGETTPTYTAIKNTIRESFKKGFFTYDELFIFAEDALNTFPSIADNIQQRFPICFIDEAQDCSEIQNKIISQIFPIFNLKIIRQRFGDGNQAIYDGISSKGAATELFPINDGSLTVSDSFRMNQKIANLADPLGITPYKMKGKGGQLKEELPHTIFLFEETSIKKVLPAFGHLLKESFIENDLCKLSCKDFHAVGMIHRDNDEQNENTTHIDKYTVSSYWADYVPDGNKIDMHFDYMVEHLMVAVNKVEQTQELYNGLDTLSRAIIGVIRKEIDSSTFPITRYPYRQLIEIFKSKGGKQPEFINRLQELFSITELNKENWERHKPFFIYLIEKLTGKKPTQYPHFFDWNDSVSINKSTNVQKQTSNLYIHEEDGRKFEIKLGSIHSVKGQDHLATLVLDTSWQDRTGKTNLNYLIDWITCKKAGAANKSQQDTRLKCHYVAMTRPTDLLCLAIPKKSIDTTTHGCLEKNGWRIETIS